MSYIGCRIAELELRVAIAQLMRKYRMEYHDDKPMDYNYSEVYREAVVFEI